uniref:Uncharacterized protein n=1 Tax=Anguilla anguilla TaxID=7936 RepID=A0A0E9VAW1_ANGAN
MMVKGTTSHIHRNESNGFS